MSQKLLPARGTRDILGADMERFRYVVETARDLSARYGFKECATPIFEFTEVFKRTLGDTSDIVSKEMYCFEDRGGESLTLRPEFTAAIVRSVLSNGLTQDLPCKFFSSGPVFRYERPQKGRFRQFHQVNFELIGTPSYLADIEVITLGHTLLKTLGINDHITLEINSLGDKESRECYRSALVAYLEQYESDLSEDSKIRLKKNPLRILDSKDPKDREIVADAPKLDQSYTDEAKQFFDNVQDGLNRINIAFTINKALVRGLDYYSHTAFEFTTTQLGSQNAVLAGGRYDNLFEIMGAKPVPAVGFAGGIERISELMNVELSSAPTFVIIPIGEEAEREAVLLSYTLRESGYIIDSVYSGNAGKRMKKANKIGASVAIIMGEEELNNQQVTIRDMKQGNETKVKADQLIDHLAVYKR